MVVGMVDTLLVLGFIFDYEPFDPCASVNIPDFMDFIAQRKKIVDFTKLCLKGRKVATKRIGN